MNYTISYNPSNGTEGEFALPASKSISNRALILNALGGGKCRLNNIAKCDDTDVMSLALTKKSGDIIDIGAAGTSMRFLTAYLSNKEGEWTITGTARMKERPISILVDALRTIGAEIEYAEKDGFPPLRIHGKKLKGGEIEIDGSVSSQYISALMMIAPYTEKGLRMTLKGEIASVPYIRMTMALMSQFGAKVRFEGNVIDIPKGEYAKDSFTIEGDWSGASYWYEICALTGSKRIFLPALFEDSLQGDSVVRSIFTRLGVETKFENGGVALCANEDKADDSVFEYDFLKCPDLAQTIVCTCLALGRKFNFTGLKSLKIKETDRINALIKETAKFGFVVKETEGVGLAWDGERKEVSTTICLETYKDHRMAMAFAPISAKMGAFDISDPMVVTKSYPGYWTEIEKTGSYKVNKE